jgi:hypothetical protein
MSAVRELERPRIPDAPSLELPAPRRPARRLSAPVAQVLVLAAMALLVTARDAWAAELVLLALLFTVPGVLALRALRVPGEAVAACPVYVPTASLVVLLAAGLAANFAGPPLGFDEPLRTGPLLAAVEGACLLLVAAGARAPASAAIPWRALGVRAWHLSALLLPLAAAAGAARLTNGHGAALAVATLIVAVALIFVGTLAARRMSASALSFVLFGVGLAAAWSFSLRSRFLYGWDVSSEYHVLVTTYADGVWHSSHPFDAYGAMLSLTVLPSTLQALTGLSSLVLLKAVYPALFALLPVGVFALASRFLDRRYAFVAGAFVAVQSYFFQQLTAIARQEIALVLFVGLVAAILDGRLPRRAQWPLASLLGAGVVVSHYSTTYLAIPVLAAAIVLALFVSIFRRPATLPGAAAVACLVMTATAAAWYGPVTHSTANLSDFTGNVREHGLALLPNAQRGQSVVQTYLSGNQPARIPARRYEAVANRQYVLRRPYVRPLPAARAPRYALSDGRVPDARVRVPLARNGLRSAQILFAQIANLLAIVGALALAVRKRSTPRARLLGILGLATLLLVGVVRVSGTAANAYNQERAFVQMMIPLGVALGWVLQWVAERRRRGGGRRVPGVAIAAATGLATTLFATSGLLGATTGGSTPTNVTDRGEDFERFYVTPPELAAADWLAATPRRALVYTDRYGQLRVLAATGRTHGLLLDVTPRTLDRHAWVYASETNVSSGRARGDVGSRYAIFRWPRRFLDDYYDTVYSNGHSEVYHR